jgi:hypothetical protein
VSLILVLSLGWQNQQFEEVEKLLLIWINDNTLAGNSVSEGMILGSRHGLIHFTLISMGKQSVINGKIEENHLNVFLKIIEFNQFSYMYTLDGTH